MRRDSSLTFDRRKRGRGRRGGSDCVRGKSRGGGGRKPRDDARRASTAGIGNVREEIARHGKIRGTAGKTTRYTGTGEDNVRIGGDENECRSCGARIGACADGGGV